jgi:CheY-like chemotaxis protein
VIGRTIGEVEVAMGQLVGRESPLDGVCVLLVEDHEAVREVISRLLVEFGATVTATAGVAEALEAFERERPDVVVSDIQMAGENGYSLIQKLRALPRDRGGQTPAAGLTGLSTVEDRVRVLRAGFQYYVEKPVDARTLVNIVASLASRSTAVRKGVGRMRPYRTSEARGAATVSPAG